jgi:NADPH:quinone reductase
MRAVLLDAQSPPSSLRVGEVKDPKPSLDEVLVRVQAASLNPVDFKVAAIGSERWSYPHVLGVDASGVIEQVGAKVYVRDLGADEVIDYRTENIFERGRQIAGPRPFRCE